MKLRADPASCGCCEPEVPATPEPFTNQPGQSVLQYRIGTYATFRAAMLQFIARAEGLAKFTARGDDDYGIALLDLWAYVADVLTFYQERYANEAFLRTATQRDAVLRLAAAVAYQPRPGVAAEVDLAFMLDTGKAIVLPPDLKVQSVPAKPDDQPQKFETRGTLVADAALNRLSVFPVPTSRDPLPAGATSALLPPGETPLSAGLGAGDRYMFCAVGAAPETVRLDRFGQAAPLAEVNWSPALAAAHAADSARRFVRSFRLFGHDAPASYTTAVVDTTSVVGVRWSTNARTTWSPSPGGFGSNQVDLDARYDDLAPGAWLVFVVGSVVQQVAQVTAVAVTSVTIQPNTASVTRVTINAALSAAITDTRVTEVFEVGATLPLWNQGLPPSPTISGSNVAVASRDPLDTLLARDRKVLLIDRNGESLSTRLAAAPVSLDGVTPGLRLWRLTLADALTTWPWAESALLGNVITARHGETVLNEILGDGDATAQFQRFTPKKQPVAYETEALAPRGAASHIELRANGIALAEVPTLFGQSPDAAVFDVALDPDLKVQLIFGDGVTGARLPSGRANITATYRQGGGSVGNVPATSIRTLIDRPLGVRAVVNPAPAAKGTDAETLEEARTNAPATVVTLDRVVSLMDFATAARTVPGIGKARAEWALVQAEMGVRLAVAGSGRTRIVGNAAADLRRYLDARRDRFRKLLIVPHVDVDVSVQAVVYVEPSYRPADVQAAIEAATTELFGFEALELGSVINLSDLIAALQRVGGVRYVDVNRLGFTQATEWSDSELRRRSQSFTGTGATRRIDPVQSRLLLAADELARLADLNLIASRG